MSRIIATICIKTQELIKMASEINNLLSIAKKKKIVA